MHARSQYVAVGLAAAIFSATATGCAPGRRPGSYLPVGASAWYGDQTIDGVTVSLRVEPAAASALVTRALRASGYEVGGAADSRRVVRTAARRLGADTSVVITAQVLPYQADPPAVSVVLTGTYSVPSRRVRNAPIIQPPGQTHPLYGELRAVRDTLLRLRAP
jgi:hypothetical protein